MLDLFPKPRHSIRNMSFVQPNSPRKLNLNALLQKHSPVINERPSRVIYRTNPSTQKEDNLADAVLLWDPSSHHRVVTCRHREGCATMVCGKKSSSPTSHRSTGRRYLPQLQLQGIW